MNEAILFETRPNFWNFVGPRVYLAISTVVLAGLLLAIGPGLDSGSTTGFPLFSMGLPILLFAGAAIITIAAVFEWFHTSYGCTNRRILRKSGVFNRTLIDARFDRIQCVTLTEAKDSRLRGIGTLLFSLSVASPRSIFSGVQDGGILWRSVNDPVELKAFIEAVQNTFDRFDREGIHVELED